MNAPETFRRVLAAARAAAVPASGVLTAPALAAIILAALAAVVVPALAVAAALVAPAGAQTSCGAWTVTPVPFDDAWWTAELHDVTVLPDGTAWACGQYKTLTQPGWKIETFTLTVFWDGSAWHHVPTPSPSPYPGGTRAYLNGIDALAPDDVWAGGARYGDAGGESVGDWPMVQHFDGSDWSLVPVPEPPGGVSINFSGPRVHAVVACAEDDVWFGGLWGEPNAVGSVTWRPLALHWDGSELSVHATPAPQDGAYGFQIVDLSDLAPDDIWAACNIPTAGGQSRKNVVLHYDGGAWSLVAVPDSDELHTLRQIVAIAPDDVWVFGDYYLPETPFALHFDGTSWTEMAGPALTGAAAALSATEIYLGKTEVTLFDGDDFAIAQEFPDPTGLNLFDLEAAGSCTLWAVGRTTGGGTRPFAARMDPASSGGASWTIVEPGLAGSHGTPAFTGTGELLPDTPVVLALDDAAELSSSYLVVGLSELGAPVHGGVLVPAPDFVVPGLPTGATGGWTLPATWPAGMPSGFSIWFQVWVRDAAGPAGWSASRALRAEVP